MQVTYDIIRRRLQMENPHKQWLAVDLTRHLLGACRERLRPYRTELLYHVARVAIKPNKKGPITAQHNARKAATDYLHQCGDEGQNALRMARMQLGNVGNTQSMPIGNMGGFSGEGAPPGYFSTVPPSCACPAWHPSRDAFRHCVCSICVVPHKLPDGLFHPEGYEFGPMIMPPFSLLLRCTCHCTWHTM